MKVNLIIQTGIFMVEDGFDIRFLTNENWMRKATYRISDIIRYEEIFDRERNPHST